MPENAGDNASYNYVGKHQKETDYTSPITGGMIQVDLNNAQQK